jgi:hypothetical protein
MRPEDFAALKRRMEARGVKVTNTTPKDSQEKRYATHEEFEAAWRRLGIPVKNVTPPPEARKHEVIPFGSERYREWLARRREEEEEGDDNE